MVKKILFLNDIHCGHLAGLTHPDYFSGIEQWRDAEEAGWNMFDDFLKAYGPFWQVVCVGDLIDGPGCKSNGRHLISTDMHDQCKMAKAVIEALPIENDGKVAKHVFVRGSEYHTDRYCCFEDFIAEHFNATIGSHLYHIVDQCVMDIKHKTTTAAIGLRNVIDNAVKWHINHGTPKPDLIVRGHIHEFQRYERNGCTVITLPGAQMFSDFGQRNVERGIDFGFCAVEIEDGQFRGKLNVELAQLSFCNQNIITRG